MLKRETERSVLRKVKADITNASVYCRLLYSQMASYDVSHFLCLRVSQKGTTIERQSKRSITLAWLLFLIKKHRLILLTSLIRLNISIRLPLYTPSETTNLDF
jgi:hypothetical protein